MSVSPRVSADATDPSPEAIKEIAADWISRRDAGLCPTEEKAFQAWLAANPRHPAAFEALQPAWSVINGPRHAGRGGDLRRQVAAQVARRMRRRYAVAISSLTAAAVIAFAFISRNSSVPDDPTPTVARHPDLQRLPDGSTVELNFGAEIATDFDPTRRGVRLLRGEALFHVAKDESRPFVVAAGAVAVRAVGTVFTVRFEPREVNVLVTEGRVAVKRTQVPVETNSVGGRFSDAPDMKPESPAALVLLSAGRRIVFSADPQGSPPSPQVVSAAEVAAALAWRNRRVEFDGTPLSVALEIFNRDNAVQLTVADSLTGELRISGIYWTNDPEAFSRVVEISLGIKAVQEHPGKIVLQR